LILTHCHIDHIGSAPFLKKQFGTKILIHETDAAAVERGDSRKTAQLVRHDFSSHSG
jgi:glyoxylase-like metal-dependent hydrolase (beta-lactamase superfamily II)